MTNWFMSAKIHCKVSILQIDAEEYKLTQRTINHFVSGAALLLTVPVAALADDLKSQDIYKQSLPSVMTLKVLKNNGDNVLGTGFMAIKDGMAITAWHVVRDAKSVNAKFSDGQEFESSGLVDKDEKRDIALIRVKVFGKNLLPVATSAPDVGSTAYVIGAPEGLEFSITSGLLSQIQASDGINHYQFSCPASPGNSGGPLINAQGQVIGVVSFQLREGQNLNFAVPSTYVLGLDATLPTQAWGSIKDTLAAPLTPGATANDEVDKLLARCFVTSHNLPILMENVRELIVMKKGGYNAGIPSSLYQLQESAKNESDALGKISIQDATRQRLVSEYQVILTHQLQSVDFLIDGVHAAQNIGGWSPAANDAISRSLAAIHSDIILAPEDINLLNKSPAFMNALPSDVVEMINTKGDDGTGFHLGLATPFFGSPLWIPNVPKDSLADKMGMKMGDNLISCGETRFTSLTDFKRVVKANLGHEIKVTIFRDGKQQEIKMKVPDQLPQ